mmetsp:Transcript_33950/g.62406  ORF Transcript_33950/g.62406 Transcript_33950/m.62406 type:complete len:320 (-) Transcript_33950:961-1920(-)
MSMMPPMLHTNPIAAFSSSPLPTRHSPLQPPRLSILPSSLSTLRSRRISSLLIAPITSATTVSSKSKPAIHQDEEGNCVFGKKEYWDEIYSGTTGDGDGDDDDDDTINNDDMSITTVTVAPEDRRPSESYSWYCGWDELAPFWTMLVPDTTSRVVIAGIGNDPSPVQMYDAGWTNMMAYDYSRKGVDRAKELFASSGSGMTTPTRDGVELMTADAKNLPLETASVDATLDKGTLDAIFITGKEIFRQSVKEMGRVTAEGGRVVSVSTVIDPNELLGEFDTVFWENVHDGSLAFAEDGEASIDLGAELYSWKRTGVPFDD